MSTGTAAAAAGGITTVVDMPLNSYPAVVNASLLAEKQDVAKVCGLLVVLLLVVLVLEVLLLGALLLVVFLLHAMLDQCAG